MNLAYIFRPLYNFGKSPQLSRGHRVIHILERNFLTTNHAVPAETSKNEKCKIEPNLNVIQPLETPNDLPEILFARRTHLNPMQKHLKPIRNHAEPTRAHGSRLASAKLCRTPYRTEITCLAGVCENSLLGA